MKGKVVLCYPFQEGEAIRLFSLRIGLVLLILPYTVLIALFLRKSSTERIDPVEFAAFAVNPTRIFKELRDNAGLVPAIPPFALDVPISNAKIEYTI